MSKESGCDVFTTYSYPFETETSATKEDFDFQSLLDLTVQHLKINLRE